MYGPAHACVHSREVAVGMTGQYKSLKSTNLVLLIRNIKKVSNMEHINEAHSRSSKVVHKKSALRKIP